MDFTKLIERMDEIASEWDGDNPGLKEDRAMAAQDVIQAVATIKANLEYLNEN